jgi:hypothetical protein
MTASLQPAQPAGPANSTTLILANATAVALGDDVAAYDDLAARIAGAVAPAGIIEELWVRDVVDLVWEVVRLRRYKANLLATRASDGMTDVLQSIGESFAYDKAKAWAARTPTGIGDVNAALSAAGVGLDAVAACTFVRHLDKFERIEKLIAAAEARRAATLREIEGHRGALAARLRAEADRAAMIAEGEFEEVAPAAGTDA